MGPDPTQALRFDRLERIAWTAVQVGAAAAIDYGTSGGELTWRTLAIAVGLAVGKAILGPHVGRKGKASIP